MACEVDRINRSVWRSDRVFGLFARREGVTDMGEALVIARVSREARGQPVLDIGVGGGRTVPYLQPLSADYVAVDYLEEMVSLTRSRYPDARVELADARDLSVFADSTFSLAFFSCAGIDGVAHEDRPKVYAEVHRVLQPDGLFAYSTHNLDYQPTWRLTLGSDWRRVIRDPWHAIGHVLRLPKRIRAYRRLRTLNAHGDGWASRVAAAYDSVAVWHHVTLGEALRELRESGFTDAVEVYGESGFMTSVEAFSANGAGRDSAVDTSGSQLLHFVARKPAQSGAADLAAAHPCRKDSDTW
jgi:SAM-dependent methyltransferase